MNIKKNAIIPIFFTIFLDLLGLGIVIPVLPAVILNPAAGLLPMDYAFAARTLIYGFLIASYPLAQFFGAPILGTLADRYGRKKLLTVSLLGTMFGYALFAIGIVTGNIFLLFGGRLLDGFTGGNISIAQSAIADISDETNKSRNFGLIGMAFGLGFIIGPYIGGKLSDPSIVSWFTFATPFWVAMGLAAFNIALVLIQFPETLVHRRNVKISLTTGFRNLASAFSMKQFRTLFLVGFLLTVGFNFFTQFFQVFLIGKFHYTQSNIGDFFAYMGLWIAFAQGGVLRPLSKKFSPAQILTFSTILLAVTFPILLLPDKSVWLYVIVPFIAVFQGITQPNVTTMISNLSGRDKQGEILGINQSVLSIAQAIPPIVAGIVTSVNLNLPTLFASGATLLGWLVFVFVFERKKSTGPLKTVKMTESTEVI